MVTVTLPTPAGRLETYTLSEPRVFETARDDTTLPRIAYAAGHVVADPFADCDPWLDAAIDWDATLAYRSYLWSLGLGVAEAMDTAQRGMGLDWPTSLELIRRSVQLAAATQGSTPIVCGAGTDHLEAGPARTLDEVIAAYEQQCEAVEQAGGRIVLMASRALAACATSPDDYRRVYGRILRQLKEPAILHWLGEMFDPALAGYWGSKDQDTALQTCLDVLGENAAKVNGIKISLLDDQKEIAMRRRLPAGVHMYTGDDFNYPQLIAGDERGHSHALLGIFDAIAPAASAALVRLGKQDLAGYHAIFAPTVALARHIFRAPTRFYKTGVVVMAYLNGHQNHFVMVGGQQSARSALHLAQVFRLADQAGLLRDPELAARRMRAVMRLHGV